MINFILNKKYWFIHFWVVSIISIAGLLFVTRETYDSAPPIADFVDSRGAIIVSSDDIKQGQRLFHFRGLMNYGSFWGDGAERGPDFTAEALHQVAQSSSKYYQELNTPNHIELMRSDLKSNTYSENNNTIVLTDAYVHSFVNLKAYYQKVFTDNSFMESMKPTSFITDQEEINKLTAFFFWGAWCASTNRPNETYSYTHNWPYDPLVGNSPSTEASLWSFISVGLLFAGIMLTLYVYGMIRDSGELKSTQGRTLTTYDLENSIVRPTQIKTYKFFVFSMILFLGQVAVGILSAMDFASIGVDWLPYPVLRSYHIMFQIYWFFLAWVGYTLYFLPRLSPVPPKQGLLIDILFYTLLFIGVGGSVGIYLGQMGYLTGDIAYWFGSQGWEFMELGRFFSFLLVFAFSFWIYIIYRGVKPWITKKNFWSIPSWILWGSGLMVFFLFFGLFATVDTNFAITDFWRWMVVHMWVEVTFEVFTTVIVAYLLVQMGFTTKALAEKVIYLSVILFLITATVGVAHNFYWIAKPTSILALGSTFSTLQILPLLLLTFDVYKMRKDGKDAYGNIIKGNQKHLMDGVWLFILAVNFWNIFGAGVLGSMINLPIVNYYEHSTYLTGNHAHAAMFGVKGNIALAGMLFVAQHLIKDEYWNPKIVVWSFWLLNIGIALMMFFNLFPIGIYQFYLTLEHGLWYARTQEVVNGTIFQTLVVFRSIGGAVFLLGTVLLVYFIVSRNNKLKEPTDMSNSMWKKMNNDWLTEKPKPN